MMEEDATNTNEFDNVEIGSPQDQKLADEDNNVEV